MIERRPKHSERVLECPPGSEIVIRARGRSVVVSVTGDAELSVRPIASLRSANGAAAAARPRDVRVEKALAALSAEPNRRFTARELAKIAGASRSTLTRLFVTHVGASPSAWLAQHRLELAQRLLTETDAGLAEIASRVGYGSEFALSRAFKRRFGKPPGVFRRSAWLASHPVRAAA